MTKKAFKNLRIFILVVTVTISLINVFYSCTNNLTDNNKEIENLKLEILNKDLIIKEYEDFRQLSKDIYINQVDSTGDGFDETDQGVDFWHKYNRIDTLINRIDFVW